MAEVNFDALRHDAGLTAAIPPEKLEKAARALARRDYGQDLWDKFVETEAEWEKLPRWRKEDCISTKEEYLKQVMVVAEALNARD